MDLKRCNDRCCTVLVEKSKSSLVMMISFGTDMERTGFFYIMTADDHYAFMPDKFLSIILLKSFTEGKQTFQQQ